MAIDLLIRPAVAADAEAVVAMVQRLARFEHAPTPPRFDVTSFGRDVCAATPRLAILVAELEQRLVGCVTMFATYSTWEGGPSAGQVSSRVTDVRRIVEALPTSRAVSAK